MKSTTWLKLVRPFLELQVRSTFPEEFKTHGQRRSGYLKKNWILLGRRKEEIDAG